MTIKLIEVVFGILVYKLILNHECILYLLCLLLQSDFGN